ncbi:MAG: hypothetical protein ACK52I_32555, partial [Pseudomonadota bacterium]
MITTFPQADLERRLVRYGMLRPCTTAFIDTRTPGSERKENFTIIGPGVAENPDQHVHIDLPHGFNIGGARQPPRCVNSQHSHETAEVFVVHTGTWRYMLWIADGFISGAGTGFAYSILRHPIDVMRHAVTAPDSPKRFTGVADVLLTTLRHKPQNIFEIYKGFPVAAAASATRCSVFFGLYHTWKYDAGSCHIAVFFALAQVSAIVAELAHYPWLKL